MTKEAYQLWIDVSGETFIDDLRTYLVQRLKDEQTAADEKKKIAEKEFEGTSVAVISEPKPVQIWFQFTTHADRVIIKAVGKDFALVKSTATGGEKKICFNHIVEYRDVTAKEE